jgi:hypothetical protein
MKKYAVLIVILVLLVAIGVLLELPRIASRPSSKVFVSVSPSAAASIEISQGTSSLALRDTPTGWTVSVNGGEYPADPARIDGILLITEKMEGEVVSVNPENHPIFGVDRASATLATLTDEHDSTLASILVGKPSRDFTSTYVRLVHSEDVYAVTGFLKSSFRSDPDFYRKRTILSFQEADLETLKLVYPEKSLTFARDTLGEMALLQPKDSAFDSTSFKRAISTLSRLSATGFEDSADIEGTGLRFPKLMLTAILRNGQFFTLSVGDLKDDSYYLMKEGDPTIYLVNRSVTEKFYRTYEAYLGR